MDYPTKRLTGRHAFTLVELLIVISIITLLASLIVVGAVDAFRRAHQVQCAAHMQQIATAVQGYWNRFGGKIPPAKFEHSDGSESYWVHYLIRTGCLGEDPHRERDDPTLLNTVLLCPSTVNISVAEPGMDENIVDSPDEDTAQGWYRLGSGADTMYCSYYWNGRMTRPASPDYRDPYWEYPSLLVRHNDPDRTSHMHHISEVKQRSRLVMLTDGVWSDGHADPERIAARHGKGSQRTLTNVAFYDGHVETIERNPGTEEDWQDDLLLKIVDENEEEVGPPFFRLKDARATLEEDDDD